MPNIDKCRKLLSWYCRKSPHQLLLQFPNKQDWLPWEQYYENQTHTRCSISQGRNSGIEIAGFQVFFKTTIDISNVELHIYKNQYWNVYHFISKSLLKRYICESFCEDKISFNKGSARRQECTSIPGRPQNTWIWWWLMVIYILWCSVCVSRKIITSHFRAERRRREVSSPLGLAGRRPALA